MHISDVAHLIRKAGDAVDALESIASSARRIADALEKMNERERQKTL